MTQPPDPFWLARAPRPKSHQRYTESSSGVRLYPIPHPSGKGFVGVPGVTSVLGSQEPADDKRKIKEWRERCKTRGIDHELGNRRGSRVHAGLESHVRGIAPTFLPPELTRPAAEPDDWEYWHKQLAAAAGGPNLPLLDELRRLAETMGHGDALAYALERQLVPLVHQAPLLALLDACFYSGMTPHLEPYTEFLWNERPLVRGWEHVWSAEPGDPDRLARLWSYVWGVAGTPDLLGRRESLMILSDFKTSNQPYFRCHGVKVPQHKMLGFKKYKKTVRQLCAYRLLFKELLDIDIDGLQILVGLPGYNEAQMFFIQGHELEVETEAFKQSALAFWRSFEPQAVAPLPPALPGRGARPAAPERGDRHRPLAA